MLRPRLTVLLIFAAIFIGLTGLLAQDTLSAQVLRLLDRANSWSLGQIFAADIQLSAIHTAAPTGTDCDSAPETGKLYWDSTNDLLWICSGVTGWRKITTAAGP